MPMRARWTIERGVLWAIELESLPPQVEPRIPARFEEAGLESIPALAALTDSAPEIMRQRLATGRRCFAAWMGSVMVAYGWVSQRAEYIGEQEREIQLEPDEAYIWDCLTAPSARGRHLYSALLSHINRQLYDEHLKRAWIGADLDNYASLRGFRTAGFQPILYVTYARLGPLRLSGTAIPPTAPRELAASARRVWFAGDEHAWGSIAWSWSQHSALAKRVAR